MGRLNLFDFSSAEEEGFEPPVPLRAHLISSQAHSTTLAFLQMRGGTFASSKAAAKMRHFPRCNKRGSRGEQGGRNSFRSN